MPAHPLSKVGRLAHASVGKPIAESDTVAKRLKVMGGVAYVDKRELERLQARIAALEAALRDVYEIYAGSEGLPESTASEAYLARLVRQMAHRAAETFTVETGTKHGWYCADCGHLNESNDISCFDCGGNKATQASEASKP